MNGPPPPLRLIGPAANNPHYEKVSELRRRLGVAYRHPSITAEQRESIRLAEVDLGYASDDARLSIPMILLEVEAMPRPANGGSRKRLRTLRMRLRKTLRMRSLQKKHMNKKRTHRK